MTLQQLLGVELPIIQAPMAGVQGSALAVAVCNAGGLGSLPCAMLGLDAMFNELAAIKAQTSKPFNVNFFATRHLRLMPSAKRLGELRLRPITKSMELMQAAFPLGRGACPSVPKPLTC